ncbi:MAG: DUF3105 domain-containing protein [Chloroflexota bacterium]|nr:DUF3105 domain-containing protein [Chloroflexota bacterium]
MGSRWQRQAWTVGIGAGVLALAILGLRAAGVFEPPAANVDLNTSANVVAPGEVIGTKVASQGSAHLLTGQKASYNSEPPTSGEHWNQSGVAPAPWGIKDSMLPREVTTHNLEHGGIVIGYSRSLAPDEVTKLKSLVRGLGGTGFQKIILEPYPLADAKIAVTAWIWILKLPEYDETQIVKFVKAHYQSPDAPEPNGF